MAKTIEDFYVHQTDAARVDNLFISPTYFNCELYGYSVKNDDSGLDRTFRGGGMGHGAGCIIGTLTGKFIDVGVWRAEGYWQELIQWQIRLFNPIWLVDGTASYIAYVNFGLKLSLYESVGNFFLHTPENLTYNSEGLPTFYFRPGNTRWTAIEAPVWKDHFSKTQWRPYYEGIDDGKRDSFYLKGKVNYFPDVDPDYLRYGNPKKYDDLWSANLNWIELTKEFWTPGSIYWFTQGQYVFNGYNTMDYTIDPRTGHVWGSYTGAAPDQVDYWNKYVPDVPYISEPFTAGQNSVNFRTNIQYYSPTAVTASGLCFSTSINPTTANTKFPFSTVTGEQINAITGLTAGTVYYVRAYATNAAGTTYSAQKMFKTTSSASKVAPEVSTATVTEKIETAAKGGGTILNDGGDIVTERGVEVSTVNDFATKTVVADAQQGSGNFVVEATSLTPDETYYVRAYAKNAVGTGYGTVLSFTAGDETPAATLPDVKTDFATGGTDVGINISGTIINKEITENTFFGMIWGTTPTLTTALTTKTEAILAFDTENNVFETITGLTPDTDYYFTIYVTNSIGTAYGEVKQFRTLATSGANPIIETGTVTNVTKSSADISLKILNGAAGKLEYAGICYSTNPNPTYMSAVEMLGDNEVRAYGILLRNLLPGTTYYARSYGYISDTNSYIYGDLVSFTTEAAAPIVDEITDVSLPGSGEAYVEGSTITDGGNEVVERGFVYSKYPNPLTTTGTKIVGGTGNQTLYAQLTGLEPSTTYYIRMYSIDTAGNVTYGTQQSFVTLGNRVVAVPGQSVRISHTITKSEFINRVMLIMNEAGIYDGQGNPFSGADQAQIDRYIAGSFVDAWRRCASVMPRAWFKNQSFKNYPLFPNLSDGTGYVVLPEDFYLLTSFKMSGWKKAVYEAFVENERTASIQANTYTRGSTIRPVITSSNKSIDITPINITVVEDDIQIERYIRPGYIIYSPTTDKLYTCPADTYAWRGRFSQGAVYSKGNLMITDDYKVYKARYDGVEGMPSANAAEWTELTGTSPVLKQLYVGSDYDYGTEPNIKYKRGDYYIGTSIGMEKLSLELNGINQVLNYYSLNRGLSTHTIEEAIYVPACNPLPDNDDTDLELDQRIIEPLAYLSASTVFTIFEKYDIAKALEQRVIEMFPGFKSIKGNNVTIKQ